MPQVEPYQPHNPIRIITAAALYDGHDASINVMRRIMQAAGAEVIHLGHNRSVQEIADAAIQEDAQGVAITSYQGGHMEFFTYLRRMLDNRGAQHIRIFGGGGGVIVPSEIQELREAGIDRIFSPQDGLEMGLQGMINEVLKGCDFDPMSFEPRLNGSFLSLARRITAAERSTGDSTPDVDSAQRSATPVIGLTGTGGAGKSSLTDELICRFLNDFPEKKVAVLCVDPSRRRSGGALLGDRIRFNTLKDSRVFIRSLATRNSRAELSAAIEPAIDILKRSDFDLILVETAGIGQGNSAIVDVSDLSLYVMTSEYGAPSQLEKIEMLDYADFVVINKFTRRGSQDALNEVRRQYRRNHELFDLPLENLPVFGTSAAHFNDSGVNALYGHLIQAINRKFNLDWASRYPADQNRATVASHSIIPPDRERYLSEISQCCREFQRWVRSQSEAAADLEGLLRAISLLQPEPASAAATLAPFSKQSIESCSGAAADLMEAFNRNLERLEPSCRALLRDWDSWAQRYRDPEFVYTVRDKKVRVRNHRLTLSGTPIPKVKTPPFLGWADRLHWRLRENVAGEFPFTAGVFPFKRQAEDPTRMFAGEGPAERTNRRFHLLAAGQPAKRLSTAFDSITLYGGDPDRRPDIYGKIGESGVSVFSVEEAERLYAGFDLCAPETSVSMTINGPAPTILAFFFNAAIRQHCRGFLIEQGRLDAPPEAALQPDEARGSSWRETRALLEDAEYEKLSNEALTRVRGTVQADILKEDQGQNTCIFSTEFSLKTMGDVQRYFIDHGIRNFYSVSISGYHIAEAGANPIHQLAYTLANGFTYLEYYRSRGMKVDDFCPNLSFFFSNGMDAEYSVIGRVARRIWAVALKKLYGADERSQKLKYHIQTSGRSLHAMDIDFNDIRTTLQALLAVLDNAQSLHTNAYDEAITTPTQESVRRAMAIQVIIDREFGLTDCENALQGSFIIEELTALVEEAVLTEFDNLTARGGVLGAMELQYQRGQIQEDSLKYERLKHSGELPIVGVNTFLSDKAGDETPATPIELSRATPEEKEECIRRLEDFQQRHQDESETALQRLRETALEGGNIFAELMETVQSCSLGQIAGALYQVGGEYRRNM